MWDSFLVAFSVVAPMAIFMLIGVIYRRAGVVDRKTMTSFDALSFKLFLPVLLFKNIYESDFKTSFDGRLVLIACGLLTVLFLLLLFIPRLYEKDNRKTAAVAQAMVRTNYNLFGLAVAQSLFGEGNAGMVALLGAFVVPLGSLYSVIILEINRSKKPDPLRTLMSVLKNPMIIASALALLCKLIPGGFPPLISGVIKSISGVATTVCFVSLGVSLDLSEAKRNRRSLVISVLLKMLLIPAVFLSVCVMLGLRGQALCALLVLFGAPSAVSTYPMAVSMGADGPMAAQMVFTTALVSVGTMFAFIFLFHMLGYM